MLVEALFISGKVGGGASTMIINAAVTNPEWWFT